MISISRILTACALLLTSGQTVFADSAGETFPDIVAETPGAPSIRTVDTPGSDGTVAIVSYTLEELDNEEGVREIYKMLRRASRDVCSGQTMENRRTVIMKSSQLHCYRKTLQKAVSDVDNKSLTRLHSG